MHRTFLEISNDLYNSSPLTKCFERGSAYDNQAQVLLKHILDLGIFNHNVHEILMKSFKSMIETDKLYDDMIDFMRINTFDEDASEEEVNNHVSFH